MNQHSTNLVASLLLAGCLTIYLSQLPAQAHDILRQRVQQNNPLDNIQLPPQLASLTPQQLHQLAQIRELQLQREAAQQQQQQAAIQNQMVTPTGQSFASQIAAPNTAENNERHDDGTYNESGSEMEGVTQSGEPGDMGSTAMDTSVQVGNSAQTAPTFEVNWNKCPQLEPSETEKTRKTQLITKCLQSAPIPANLTRENVEAHREEIAACALRLDNWFDSQGNYNYDKAEGEIRAKKLEPAIEGQVLKFHVACKEESGKKFPRNQNRLIDQVQFYQACMDYYISIVCEIEVSVDQ